ncbi:MAG: hypothetical protein WAM28_04995 [Chlamydiales bacterium]
MSPSLAVQRNAFWSGLFSTSSPTPSNTEKSFSSTFAWKDLSSLRERICNPFLKLIPSLLILIACVTGIAYALLWRSSYLLITFVPATLCSLYIMRREYYKPEEALREQINELESVNRNLTRTQENYEALHSRIQQEVVALSDIRVGLNEENEQLRETRENFQHSFGAEQNRLEQNVDRLIEFSETFRTLLNDPRHGEAYEELISLQARQSQLNSILEGLTARIEENVRFLDRLREIQQQFNESLNDFRQQSNQNNLRFETIAQQIEQIIHFQIPRLPIAYAGS